MLLVLFNFWRRPKNGLTFENAEWRKRSKGQNTGFRTCTISADIRSYTFGSLFVFVSQVWWVRAFNENYDSRCGNLHGCLSIFIDQKS